MQSATIATARAGLPRPSAHPSTSSSSVYAGRKRRLEPTWPERQHSRSKERVGALGADPGRGDEEERDRRLLREHRTVFAFTAACTAATPTDRVTLGAGGSTAEPCRPSRSAFTDRTDHLPLRVVAIVQDHPHRPLASLVGVLPMSGRRRRCSTARGRRFTRVFSPVLTPTPEPSTTGRINE